MNPLKVAVIGAGHLGKIHARLLPQIENVELVAIAEPSPMVQRQLIESSQVPIFSDYRKILDDIDAAVIATPTRSHFEIAEVLLQNSIHVLIEKPVTDCPYQAKQLVELAREQGCVLSVGHVEQHNPVVRQALEQVGTPKFIQSVRASGYTYRSTDIGVVHDLMIHDIDLVNAAFPGRLTTSNACGFAVFGEREDMAQARLQFSCGGIATLTASRCSFSPERSMQIFGTDGFAALDLANHSIQFVAYPNWMKSRSFDFSAVTDEQREFIKANLFDQVMKIETVQPEKNNAILEEQTEWINAIFNGTAMRNTGENAAEAVRIAGQVLEQIDSHAWFGDEAAAGPTVTLVVPPEHQRENALPKILRSAEEQKAA
ncbi:MAG: Gfo/Idh/MocA family oxidoreductase [Planctomycetota bacterium]